MTLNEYKVKHQVGLRMAGLADVPDLGKYLRPGPGLDSYQLTMAGLKHVIEHGTNPTFVEHIRKLHDAAIIPNPELADVVYNISWHLGTVSYRSKRVVDCESTKPNSYCLPGILQKGDECRTFTISPHTSGTPSEPAMETRLA